MIGCVIAAVEAARIAGVNRDHSAYMPLAAYYERQRRGQQAGVHTTKAAYNCRS